MRRVNGITLRHHISRLTAKRVCAVRPRREGSSCWAAVARPAPVARTADVARKSRRLDMVFLPAACGLALARQRHLPGAALRALNDKRLFLFLFRRLQEAGARL